MENNLRLTKEEQDFIKNYNIDLTQSEEDLMEELFDIRDDIEDECENSEDNIENYQKYDNLYCVVVSIIHKIEISKMNLQDFRKELDNINQELKNLYLKRLNIVKDIGMYKKEHNLPIYDKNREDEIINKIICHDIPEEVEKKDYIINFFKFIMDESKKYQV